MSATQIVLDSNTCYRILRDACRDTPKTADAWLTFEDALHASGESTLFLIVADAVSRGRGGHKAVRLIMRELEEREVANTLLEVDIRKQQGRW